MTTLATQFSATPPAMHSVGLVHAAMEVERSFFEQENLQERLEASCDVRVSCGEFALTRARRHSEQLGSAAVYIASRPMKSKNRRSSAYCPPSPTCQELVESMSTRVGRRARGPSPCIRRR